MGCDLSAFAMRSSADTMVDTSKEWRSGRSGWIARPSLYELTCNKYVLGEGKKSKCVRERRTKEGSRQLATGPRALVTDMRYRARGDNRPLQPY